jgi:hypothetical protein
MPDLGYYEKLPRPESILFFMSRVEGHSKVISIEQLEKQLFEITKKNGKKLLVHLTNYYVVSEAEVYEIMSQHNKYTIDSIVTISLWNSYSPSGKSTAKENGIGLFLINEFLGALNFDGKAFINYITPEDH